MPYTCTYMKASKENLMNQVGVCRTTGLFIRLRVIDLQFDKISFVCNDVVIFDQLHNVVTALLSYNFQTLVAIRAEI